MTIPAIERCSTLYAQVFVATICIVFIVASAKADEVMECAQSFRRVEESSIAFESYEVRQTHRKSDGISSGREKKVEVRRSGKEWAILIRETASAWDEGERLEFSKCRETLFSETQCLDILGKGDDYKDKTYPDAMHVPLPQTARDMRLAGSIDGSRPFEKLGHVFFLGGAKLLFGHLDDWVYLPDLLSGGRVTEENAQTSLLGCMSVIKETEFGVVTAWLDPKNGFLPRRIEIHKNADDKLSNGTKIGDAPAGEPGRLWPSSKLIGYQMTIDDVDIIQFGDIPVISRFARTDTYRYEGSEELSLKTTVRCENFHNPEPTPFSPAIKIPDYTSVKVTATPQLIYYWRHGRIEPDASSETTGELEQVSHFLPPNRSGWNTQRTVLIAVNLALGLFVVLWAVRRGQSRSDK